MSAVISRVRGVESPVHSLHEPDFWTPPVDINLEALVAAAHANRNALLAKYTRTFVAALAAFWRKAVVQPVGRWLERERMIRELSRMDERELHDLGLTPGMIPYLVSATNAQEGARLHAAVVFANENVRPIRAA